MKEVIEVTVAEAKQASYNNFYTRLRTAARTVCAKLGLNEDVDDIIDEFVDWKGYCKLNTVPDYLGLFSEFRTFAVGVAYAIQNLTGDSHGEIHSGAQRTGVVAHRH